MALFLGPIKLSGSCHQIFLLVYAESIQFSSMEGSICGIHASVYDPLSDYISRLNGPPLKGSRGSLVSMKPDSTLSITKTKKYRPVLVLGANPHANFKTICLMATFGGTDYPELPQILQRIVRPVQKDHPSLPNASAIPVTPAWPKTPQWLICSTKQITVDLSPWSEGVLYTVDTRETRELRDYVHSTRMKLMKETAADKGLKQRLYSDLMLWKSKHETAGNGSIYSQVPNGSRRSLASTRTYASSGYSTSTSSLSSIPEISEDDEPVATPTPTVTTFAGKLLRNISKASRSSPFPRHDVSSTKNNVVIQDPPMKRTNASRASVSSCRSQSSGKSCCAQGPPVIRAM